MTKEEAIKELKKIRMSTPTPWENKREALSLAISALVKENEPAPAEADTSSGTQNILHLHDNTDSQKCQEVIKEARKRLLAIYEILSDEGRIAFELGELYHLLEVRLEEDILKAGEENE